MARSRTPDRTYALSARFERNGRKNMRLCARKHTYAGLRMRLYDLSDAPKRRTVAFDRELESMKDLLQRTPRCDVSRRARVARACCSSRPNADQPIRAIAKSLTTRRRRAASAR